MHEGRRAPREQVTATLPSGTVRESLAELTGIDFRGLGLLLAKKSKRSRCVAASRVFKPRRHAHGHEFGPRYRARPDSPVKGPPIWAPRLWILYCAAIRKACGFFQLRSPILIGGTLAHPSVGIQAHDSKMVLLDRGKGAGRRLRVPASMRA